MFFDVWPANITTQLAFIHGDIAQVHMFIHAHKHTAITHNLFWVRHV
jgi:hypothetical protein